MRVSSKSTRLDRLKVPGMARELIEDIETEEKRDSATQQGEPSTTATNAVPIRENEQ